jgi:hypothetical protein
MRAADLHASETSGTCQGARRAPQIWTIDQHSVVRRPSSTAPGPKGDRMQQVTGLGGDFTGAEKKNTDGEGCAVL